VDLLQTLEGGQEDAAAVSFSKLMTEGNDLREAGAVNSGTRIAVVFATMNRCASALSCVDALRRQTRPPELVVVADNCSTDDTVTCLEALVDLPFELVVHRMDENRGNAGGVEVVMDLGFLMGADAVWILDDDSWPQAQALDALLEDGLDSAVVRHSLQIDPKTGGFTWPLQIFNPTKGWYLVGSTAELPDESRTLSRISWTGALLPKRVRDVVGPVNGSLFIRGEDEEYPWRFEQAGFTQEAVHGSILDHPGPEDVVHLRFFGKSFFFERGLANWKLYYKVRNMVWLKGQQSGRFKSILMAAVYTIAACGLDGPQRLPLLVRAVADGWRGRLGRYSGTF
jgi:rhamnopyranosyl-N-acetylglucosaminyl-diphospho-decaprenol beta-1,3/1,4-galactofuranosyltransferase